MVSGPHNNVLERIAEVARALPPASIAAVSERLAARL